MQGIIAIGSWRLNLSQKRLWALSLRYGDVLEPIQISWQELCVCVSSQFWIQWYHVACQNLHWWEIGEFYHWLYATLVNAREIGEWYHWLYVILVNVIIDCIGECYWLYVILVHVIGYMLYWWMLSIRLFDPLTLVCVSFLPLSQSTWANQPKDNQWFGSWFCLLWFMVPGVLLWCIYSSRTVVGIHRRTSCSPQSGQQVEREEENPGC